MKFKNILVPYDNSSNSKRAFNSALELAKMTGSRIRLVSCIEKGYWGNLFPETKIKDPEVTKAAKRQEKTLAELQKRAQNVKVASEKKIIKTTNPSKSIITLSKSPSVDLIVMGTHGRTGLDKVVFGSVAEKVTKLARCPVMIVK